MPSALYIIHVSTAADARHYRDFGYCPVECSFGDEPVVNELQMDHHGSLSALEPVSLRAYRDFAGFFSLDSRFVVAGAADADATFAIAALAGFLPRPGFAVTSGTPGSMNLRWDQSRRAEDSEASRRLLALAQTVAKADLNPFAERWEESPEGVLLLAFKQQMQNSPHNADSFHKGVDLWRTLTTEPSTEILATVQAKERERVQQARLATVLRLHPQVAFVESPVWGWDVWYAEIAPVIVAYQAQSGRCSIGCRDEEAACRLFGLTGLLAVTEKLKPLGWGGRSTIIGSPRGLVLSYSQAVGAAQLVTAHIQSSSSCVTSKRQETPI